MADNVNMTTLRERETNYFRLVKLTMTEGTKAIERTVTQNLPGGQTLQVTLLHKESRIRSLRNVFSSRQLAILYPASGNCTLSDIDMTLWCSLARNLTSPPKRSAINWDRPPLPGEEEWYHDIHRIRLTRNNLCHLKRPELDSTTFNDLWSCVSGALLRLNPNINLEEYKQADYNQAEVRDLEIQVKEQVLQEMNDVLRAGLAERRHIVAVVVIIGILILALIAVSATVVYFQLRKETFCGKGKRSEVIGLLDIGYHYLIDSNGLVYEGRPPDKVPASIYGWNSKIISIALIGNFMHEHPAEGALGALDLLIQHLVQREKVVSNFRLYATCNLRYNYTDSPGRHLYDAVNTKAGEYVSFGHANRSAGMCFFNHSSRHNGILEERNYH